MPTSLTKPLRLTFFIKFLKWFLCLALFVCVERFCHRQTQGFQVYKITPRHFQISDTKAHPLPADVEQLLHQPFSFLGRGGQAYAFVSEDGTTVIKFFKQHHLRPPVWIHLVAMPGFLDLLRQNWIEEIHARYTKLVHSRHVAFEKLREETGLIYLHFAGEAHFNQPLTLYDPLNIVHKLHLSTLDFAVQKRALPAYPTFKKWIKQNEFIKLQNARDSTLKLLASRCHKAVHDRDCIVKRNLGFIGEQALWIDIGSLMDSATLTTPEQQVEELDQAVRKLKKWIRKKCPTLLPFFNTRLDHYKAELINPKDKLR